jgi:tetratricopeptide (TPR) repeat protein
MNRTSSIFVAVLLVGARLLASDAVLDAQQAQRAMETGNYAEAVTLYSRLAATYPDNLDIKKNLGLAFHSAGKYRDALRCFEVILGKDPDDKAALLFSGLELGSLHESGKAIVNLSRFIEQDGSTPAALLARGRLYLSLGNLDGAIQDFSKTTALDPANAKAWEGLGKAYLLAAQAAFQKIEAQDKFSAEWYGLLARSYLSGQDYKKAYRFFREAESKDPKLPGIHSALAEVYRQTNHPEWADIESSKERQSSHDALSELRRQYLSAIDFQQRAAEALGSLSRHPDTAEYHALLGLAYRMQRRDTDSIEEFRRALAISPDSSNLKLDLATSLALSKDCEAALPLLKAVLRSEPSWPQANHVMGECLVDQNRPQEAVPFLQTALKQDPRLLPAQSALGRAYLHSGNFREAAIHLEKALSLGDPEILYQLAQAYRKLGEPKTATDFLAQYKTRKGQVAESSQVPVVEIGPP